MAEYIEREALENAFEDENKNGNFVFTANWIMEILDNLPPADVVPKSEVARKICCEIEEEIVAALESNYRVLKEYDDGRCNDYILEIVNRVQGKIDALRGIEGFVEELKKKYTEEYK